jgi:hypothetical protein
MQRLLIKSKCFFSRGEPLVKRSGRSLLKNALNGRHRVARQTLFQFLRAWLHRFAVRRLSSRPPRFCHPTSVNSHC